MLKQEPLRPSVHRALQSLQDWLCGKNSNTDLIEDCAHWQSEGYPGLRPRDVERTDRQLREWRAELNICIAAICDSNWIGKDQAIERAKVLLGYVRSIQKEES